MVVTLTTLAAVGFLAAGVASIAADNLVVAVSWTAAQMPAADGSLLVGGPTTSTLTVAAPTGVQRLLVFAPAAVLCATAVVCGVLLRRIVRSVDVGDTFHRDTPRRVAVLGVVVLAGGLVAAAITTAGRLTALSPAALGMTTPASAVAAPNGVVDVPLTALAIAATLWVIAAVLRRGSRMHADLEGLV